MPCGGIDWYKDIPPGDCYHCDKPGATHFCEEWDCMLHVRCIIPFLDTEEGKVVKAHKHRVTIWYEAEES